MATSTRTTHARNSSSLESVAVPPSPLSPATVNSPAGRTRSTRGPPAIDASQLMLTPPPSGAARPDLTARLDAFSIVSPLGSSHEKEASASTMPSPPLREQSFFAQNRTILLSGLPPSPNPSSPVPTPQMSSSSSTSISSRRPPNRRLTPLVTRSSTGGRQLLAGSLADSPMMSPRVLSPCVYVRATSLERQDAVSPRAASLGGDGADTTADGTESVTSTTTTTGDLPLAKGQLRICAIVRPSSDEKPYAIRRIVERKALARAVPKPDPRTATSVNILPSPIPCSPLSALPPLNPSHPSAVAGTKRRASPSPLSPASPHPSLRQHGRPGSPSEQPSPAQFTAAGGLPIPIRPHSALGILPGLAAVILSGHVHPGDIIEQPLPHPEAWPQTVSYTYSGCGEITDAVRANIEHLGGSAK
ncbi:hypothetical protein CMQ_4435 [Grosmannia clavigera kw1407]|uniref:Uncharacterized protein n=1 Tax=Grosmannia clavigera (strain kw1407 / UAMH 11150) TaxID=655863 RepID=F0XU48_GROCL|nr:uncharacterized protein CMQ_4435 [Grosmannia clavigera kw1407]EFW98583.1 hypothetical protein CMQ_4435 [Grosmannia clavigera kw1407]